MGMNHAFECRSEDDHIELVLYCYLYGSLGDRIQVVRLCAKSLYSFNHLEGPRNFLVPKI